jgi:hypothetical protein
MVAVSDAGLALPADVPIVLPDEESVEGQRIVAIALSPMELLRPGSDLMRMIDGAESVDLLLTCEDEPVAEPSPVGVLGGGCPGAEPPLAVVDADDDYGDDDDDDPDDLRAAVDQLGLDDLHLHRLALRSPIGTAAEPDLVAALSELVGFDPEPGVCVLAPTSLPADPQRSVIDRAVRQIVQVYGLPLRRYRCLELSVVDQ